MTAEYLITVLRDRTLFKRREGGRFQVDSGRFELRLVTAPPLLVTSGEVAFEEFYDLYDDRTEDCFLRLAPGEWPLVVATLLEGSLPGGLTVACILGYPEVDTWEAPSSDQEMVGTDYGTVCIYDRVNRPVLKGLALDDETAFAQLEESVETKGVGVIKGNSGEIMLAVMQCYGGVGTHGVWRGLDANGTPVCLLADMDAMTDFEPVTDMSPMKIIEYAARAQVFAGNKVYYETVLDWATPNAFVSKAYVVNWISSGGTVSLMNYLKN
jgi:hypothetical protein